MPISVGIFANRIKNKQNYYWPYPRDNEWLKESFRAAKELGIDLFVFSYKDVRKTAGRIQGRFYNKKWEKKLVPFPDVVYDRYLLNTVTRTNKAEELANSLIGQRVKWFNRYEIINLSGQKGETAKFLRKHGIKHPETIFQPTARQLLEMLHRHNTVYYKPVLRGGGWGIIIFRKTGKYTAAFKEPGGRGKWKQVRKVIAKKNFGIWMSEIKKRLARKGALIKATEPYIAQQGISFLEYKKRSTDIRAFFQRTGKGRPKVLLASRFGGNIDQGGNVEDIDLVLKDFQKSGVSRKVLRRRILAVVMKTLRALEDRFGYIGELGLDLGIDEKGQVWVIELNGRPWKGIFRRLAKKYPEKRRKYLKLREDAIRAPLLYAKYLKTS